MSVSVLTVSNTSFLKFEVRVEDSDWSPLYDRLEIWRSVLGESGPYEELSASSWKPAMFSSVPGANLNVSGKVLSFLVNEKIPVNITFTGTDPLTPAQVASQIVSKGLGYLNASVSSGNLLIWTVQDGGLASLRVIPGDAASLLSLPIAEPDCLKFGQDPRPVLVPGLKTYEFNDYWSEPAYFYKTRFFNSLTGARSKFSETVSATRKLGVDPALVVTGFVQLLQADGRPGSLQEVVVYNVFNATRVAGGMIVGSPQKLLTNSDGYVEFQVLRGLVFDVGVGGTSFVRKVTAPTDPSVLKFDVFDPEYGEDDNLTVQRANLPYADRKTF